MYLAVFIITLKKTEVQERKVSQHPRGVHSELLPFGHIQDKLNFQETLDIV